MVTPHALGQAVVLLGPRDKSAAAPALSYSMKGRLVLSSSGWSLLEVPNDLGNGAFKALNETGVEQPVSESTGKYRAHISVIRPEEIESIGGPSKLEPYRGQSFSFNLGSVREIKNPHGWAEVAKVWVIDAKSPDLMKLRRSLGLGDPKFAFHITFAIRKRARRKQSSLIMFKQAAAQTEVKESGTHGKGLFATTNFKDNDVVVEHLMTRYPEEDGRTRWEQSEEARYTNHSHEPNVEVVINDGYTAMVALREIVKGEELYADYARTSAKLGPGVCYTYKHKPYGGETDSGDVTPFIESDSAVLAIENLRGTEKESMVAGLQFTSREKSSERKPAEFPAGVARYVGSAGLGRVTTNASGSGTGKTAGVHSTTSGSNPSGSLGDRLFTFMDSGPGRSGSHQGQQRQLRPGGGGGEQLGKSADARRRVLPSDLTTDADGGPNHNAGVAGNRGGHTKVATGRDGYQSGRGTTRGITKRLHKRVSLQSSDVHRNTSIGPNSKRAGAEAAIIGGVKSTIADLETDGILDVWFDLGGPDGDQRAVLNCGDWCDGDTIEAWKSALSEWADDVEVFDEAGGPGPGDWVKVAFFSANHDRVMVKQGTSLAQDIAKARRNTKEPKSEAQAEAGNYPKGKFQFHGLTIAIETGRGQTRSGTSGDGKAWSMVMQSDYGDIKRTTGADGDSIDVFVGRSPDTELVFVVDQQGDKPGSFDEHKCLLGFDTEEAARAGYLANYEKGWDRLSSITPLTIPQFKWWVNHGDTNKPCASQKNIKLASQSFYLNAVNQTPMTWDAQQGIANNLMSNLQNVKARGDRAINESHSLDRLQNAMDPNRASQQLTSYLSGERQPIVNHPLDRFLQGDPIG